MAYTEFSTKKADYVLQLGCHITENKQIDIFKGIDALVIETGNVGLEKLLWGAIARRGLPKEDITIRQLLATRQFDTAIGYCGDNNIPIFGTDVPCDKNKRDLFMKVPVVRDALLIVLFRYAFSDKKLNKLFSMLYSNYCFAVQDPLIEARNAANARKIEEFVVDKLKEITGKKKPKIGLIFGVSHMGLEQDLRSKLRRNITLWNYKYLNFKKYAGLNRKELNKVYEGRPYWSLWQVEEHLVDLFK